MQIRWFTTSLIKVLYFRKRRVKQGKVEKEEDVEIELKRPFAAELSSFTTNRASSPDLSSFTCRKMGLSDLEEQSKARLPREETSEENAKANGEEGVLLPFSTVLPPTSLSLLPSFPPSGFSVPSLGQESDPSSALSCSYSVTFSTFDGNGRVAKESRGGGAEEGRSTSTTLFLVRSWYVLGYLWQNFTSEAEQEGWKSSRLKA